MLALFAGLGALPAALLARIKEPVLTCAMRGFTPEVPVDLSFRIEQLGGFLAELRARGVDRICFAGAVTRPEIDAGEIDAATQPLVTRLEAAMAQGDDGTLRAILGLFEEHGFAVVAAHEIAPDLLPESGVLNQVQPDAAMRADAVIGEDVVAQMGAADQGQACLIGAGAVVAREALAGTDAMLSAAKAAGAILFKAPKPQQDRRVDLPVIGPGTVQGAVTAGLSGIVIEAGGVMILERARVIEMCDAAGLVLWVRPLGEPA